MIVPPLPGGNLLCNKCSLTKLPAFAHGSEEAELHPHTLFQHMPNLLREPAGVLSIILRIILPCVGFKGYAYFLMTFYQSRENVGHVK